MIHPVTLPASRPATLTRLQVLGAFAAGALFAAGLALSGMTRADNVIAFLDVTSGAWDPSLAFVMVGAIAVHALAWRRIRRRKRPLADTQFHLPTQSRIDGRLVWGSALFGVGWGLSGICPGPALVAALSGAVPVLVFFGAMIAGMVVFALTESAGR